MEDLGLVWLDPALRQPRGQIVEQFAGQLVILLRGLFKISIGFLANFKG